jgi:hypothetical protein
VSGSRPIRKIVRRHGTAPASREATRSSGMSPKARLLLLCARIGYTPHASFQR